MMRWFNRIQKDEKGLTLLELIVVVAIIGILAFTITPRILQALDDSRLNSALSVGNELHNSMERYWAAKNPPAYPTGGSTGTFAELRAELTDVVGLSTTTGNVFTDFKYSRTAGTATAAETYCVELKTKSKDTPWIKVSPAGVENTGATQPGC